MKAVLQRSVKKLFFILVTMALCASSWAHDWKIFSITSPKLRAFLTNNPAATKILTNAFAEAFSSRKVRLYYFYSDDESEPKAFHFYPDIGASEEVIIGVRENQVSLDEFICILYETINSLGEKQFAKVMHDAESGSISRTEFARAILKIEFNADIRTRNAIKTLELSEKEKSESYYYGRLAEFPDDFEKALEYKKKVSPTRDALKEYELKYDAYRKTYKEYEAKQNDPK